MSIRTILLLVNLMVLALPLGSIFLFRIYENQLVRETEVELIAQSSYVAAIYQKEVRRLLTQKQQAPYGRLVNEGADNTGKDYYTPQAPLLDLSIDEPYPPRPDALQSPVKADILAQKAGAEIADILVAAQKTNLAGIRVLDYQGVVVSGRGDSGLSFAHVLEVKKGLNGHYNSVMRWRITDERQPTLSSFRRGTAMHVFTVFPIKHGNRLWGLVYLSRTPKSILKYMYADRLKFLLASLTVLLLALFVGLVTSWTIARPLQRLTGRIALLSRGEKLDGLAEEVHGISEIALLTEDFSSMAQALESRTDYIKQFANHVSHEFKTPLTSIKGAAELLEEHLDDMTKAERERFLKNIISDTDRMKRLVDRLLELARADNPALTQQHCSLFMVLKDLQNKAKKEGFKVQVKASDLPPVLLSEELIEIVFSNLIDNAAQHKAMQVTIEVENLDENHVCLKVCDNGEGISQGNRSKIFDPFFTTRRSQGGTGMGLGIVQSLLSHNGGFIEYQPAKSSGACFIVRLPLAQQE